MKRQISLGEIGICIVVGAVLLLIFRAIAERVFGVTDYLALALVGYIGFGYGADVSEAFLKRRY